MRGKALTERERLEMLLREYDERMKYNKFQNFWFPDTGQDDLEDPTSSWSRHLYPKHLEFFEASAKYNQVLFSAGNRVGKTIAGAYSLTAHLTGLYPDWWPGRRFDYPVTTWVIGQTTASVQRILQKELLGEVGEFGSGMVPRDLLDWDTLPQVSRVGGLVPGFRVKNKNGGFSSVRFLSQEMGVLQFVGASLDVVWVDEPISLDLYSELCTRLAARKGSYLATATPILGLDPYLINFCKGEFKFGEVDQYRFVANCRIQDVPHLSKETVDQLIASWPDHQVKCRTEGWPVLGQGAIYPHESSAITVDAFPIPGHWLRISGLDVGWQSTAKVSLAIDPETNKMYVTDIYEQGGLTPLEHAQNWGSTVTDVHAIDPASKGRTQTDGQRVFDLFEQAGVTLTLANNEREAAFMEINDLFRRGMLKIFREPCKALTDQLLNMSRLPGGKVKDSSAQHLPDAFRYAVFTRGNARARIDTTRGDPIRALPGPRRW